MTFTSLGRHEQRTARTTASPGHGEAALTGGLESHFPHLPWSVSDLRSSGPP